MDELTVYVYEFDKETMQYMNACNEQVIHLYQDPSGSLGCGIGATVWDSGLVLCKYLETLFQSAHNTSNANKSFEWRPEKWHNVIELGSGVGVVGLVLHRLLTSTNTLHSMCLTDKVNALPLLQKNVDAYNNDTRDKSNLTVKALDWTDLSIDDTRYDLILIADCVHWPELFKPLVDCLKRLCHAETRVLLAYERRDFESEVEFFRLFGADFRFQSIPADQMHPQWQSPDEIYLFHARLRRQGE